MLSIYLDHRIEVVRRRSEFRRRKREDRLHLVDGLMIALLDIDEVIGVIRSSDDSAAAKQRLIAVFDLSDIQAQYILDTPLRRLTRFDRLELERERGVKSIAFPAISTGIYRYPKGPAAQIAVDTCRAMADACGVETVEFVCFDEATAMVYERVLGEA